jgi:hypothetical protein
MDFSYSTPPFLTKNEKFDRKTWKIVKNEGMEYEKSMFLHGIKGITSDYELVMHHWSSRKHGIQGYLIVMGRQNLKTWPISMKKVLKVKKVKFFTRNMVYYGCTCIVSCIIPICKWASP